MPSYFGEVGEGVIYGGVFALAHAGANGLKKQKYYRNAWA